MCIRDRAWYYFALFAAVIVGLITEPIPGSVIGLLGVCLAAVSYTHLRAHETVLDLVCRLLLEKKNTLKPQPNYRY